jgi:hypothetical protein
VQEEQEERQEEPEKNGRVDDVEDPSLPENQENIEEPDENGEEEYESSEKGEDEDRTEEEVVPRRGCLKGCLTPIVTIFVILIVLAIFAYSKRDAIRSGLINRIINHTHDEVLSNLPDDMDKNTVEATFERVKTALKAKRIDEEILTEAIKGYLDIVEESPPLEEKKQAIDRLMEGLNAAVIVSEG